MPEHFFPFTPEHTPTLSAYFVILLFSVFFFKKIFSSILLKRCLLCCQGRFSRGGGRATGRQRSFAEARSRNQGEQSYNQMWTSGKSCSKHRVVRGKRKIGLENKSCKVENIGFGREKKERTGEEGKGFSAHTESVNQLMPG